MESVSHGNLNEALFSFTGFMTYLVVAPLCTVPRGCINLACLGVGGMNAATCRLSDIQQHQHGKLRGPWRLYQIATSYLRMSTDATSTSTGYLIANKVFGSTLQIQHTCTSKYSWGTQSPLLIGIAQGRCCQEHRSSPPQAASNQVLGVQPRLRIHSERPVIKLAWKG